MKISYNWLKEYVAFSLSPQELADTLTGLGFVTEDIRTVEDDFCLDVEVTSNRPDCLGMIGIAREVSAATKGELFVPVQVFLDKDVKTLDIVQLVVEEPVLCPQYITYVLRDITIKPSPDWMQKRLKCIGFRPVNNIVDVTNYVMIETGQPLHAFDLDKIAGQQIFVRRARAGEEIVTINGARRALFHDMLVIADSMKPIALAGIMGGMETEVSGSTKNILLECAQFEPGQVRRTSKLLGIASDSSYRFERGVDPEGVERAAGRAAQFIIEISGGGIVNSFCRVRSKEYERGRVTVRMDRLRKILGLDIIKTDETRDILKRLQFPVLNKDNDFIDVEIPGFRGDVCREIDLIEEIARVYGYTRVPEKNAIPVRISTKSKKERVGECIRQFLTALGYYEVTTFSIVGVSPIWSINLWSEKGGIDIANPLNIEESRLRTSLLPSLIRVKEYNKHHGTERISIFEIANVYLAGEELPREKACLSFLADMDFFSTKGVFESLLFRLGISSKCKYIPYTQSLLFKNGRAAGIQMDGRVLGYIGEASKQLGFNPPTCMVELDMDFLVEKANFARKYQPVSQYPPVFRDLALIVDEDVQWASIESCITGVNIPFLKEICLFDVYHGKQIPSGKKSLAFNLIYQAHERTLTNEEINSAQHKILDALSRNLGAELRKL